MDIQPKINSSQINKIKTVFLQHFAAYLDDCGARLEFEFGLQLGKERDKLTHEQYKKLTDYLRAAQQQDIRPQYLLKIATAFDELQQPTLSKTVSKVQWNSANLLDDEFVKEDYAVSQIIHNCEHLFLEEMSQFNQQFAMLLGKQVISFEQNPASPENLLRILFDVFKPLKLKTAYRVALYKVFDVNVFSQLGFIYRELLLHCDSDTGGYVDLPPENVSIEVDFDSVRVKSRTINNGCEALRQKLQQWRAAHTPSAYDMLADVGVPIYEHFELINALHVLSHSGIKNVLQVDSVPLKHPLLKKLEALNFSGETRQLGEVDQDILDIVALIFAEIGQDQTLSNAAKLAILPLQMPMAAVAVVHPEVLAQAESPVRQLLDKLTEACSLVNEDTPSGKAVIQNIATVVTKMTAENGFEKSDWVEANTAFSAYMNAQRHGARRCEAHYRQLMQQSEMPLTDNTEVAMIIADSTKNKSLPLAISDFIQQVWLEVLLAIYPQKNDRPELWQKYVQTLDDLTFSVIPPSDEQARQRILNLLPGLIKALRHGFKQIAYDKITRDRFFKELAVLHVLALDKKMVPTDLVIEEANATDILIKLADGDAESRLEPIMQMSEGSWLEFTTDVGKYWGKLARKSQDLQQRLLFVDKSGEKLLECGMAELAEQLLTGQVSLVSVNQQPITERSIQNLTS